VLDADHFLARGLAHTTRADLEPWQGRELNFNTGGTTGARRTLFVVLGALSRRYDLVVARIAARSGRLTIGRAMLLGTSGCTVLWRLLGFVGEH
jgi:hypothetical protein